MNAAPMGKSVPVYRMEPAKAKLIEAILFLITHGVERDRPLTQYDIVKSLFFADRSHLNRYGRPITFDNYVAMENGPVPSLAYAILKNEALPENFGEAAFPWTRVSGRHANPKAFLYLEPQRAPSTEILTESEVEALGDALSTVLGLTFSQIRKLTHLDPAYVAAWGDGESANAPMSYGMMFDVPDFEEAEQLQFASQHQ